VAKRPCAAYPRCRNLVQRGYCSDCAAKHSPKAKYDETRPSAAKRGYGRRWQATSAGRLRSHPLCVDPDGLHKGRTVAAALTDHIIAVDGPTDPLFWDPNNWQSLCWPCHGHKTVKEDGGFGRKMQ
jgi:5-methylcytosine-specific restriction protein A